MRAHAIDASRRLGPDNLLGGRRGLAVAFREIERVERRLGAGVRFAFRHFPLTQIHPHALAASAAAEAAAFQGRFWDMHGAGTPVIAVAR